MMEEILYCNTYIVTIYTGLHEGYSKSNRDYSITDVEEIVDEFILDNDVCVTITPTQYRYPGGNENGVAIGMINYPRFPKLESKIDEESIKLANTLLTRLKQNRITIVRPKDTITLTNKEQYL